MRSAAANAQPARSGSGSAATSTASRAAGSTTAPVHGIAATFASSAIGATLPSCAAASGHVAASAVAEDETASRARIHTRPATLAGVA